MKKPAKRKASMNVTRRIALSFLVIIIIGSIVLSLPLTNKISPRPYIDNLFVATSAVCVTGLSPLTVSAQYNLLGQIILILLVQIGGLGFVTFMFLFMHLMGSRISLKNRAVFQEALSYDDFTILPSLLKTIFIWTFGLELIGALILSMIFIPKYGTIKGIYFGLWHAISTFCNAGFDLLGDSSLIGYATHLGMNTIICFLIICGGIGFRVVLNIYDTIKQERKRKIFFTFTNVIRHLSLHSKLVLTITPILLLSGSVLFYILERNNPATIGLMTENQKILVSFFQSTTTRTAGFATVNMASLNRATKIIMCIFMMIGGSPASTAGGIKTTTFALCILMVYSMIHGGEDIVIFNKRIRKRLMLQALSIFAISLAICLVALIAMIIVQPNADVLDLMLEVFSGFGTVGLSASLTGTLNDSAKMIIIFLMYTGRIGPVSMMVLFARQSRKNKTSIKYPSEDILVG